ncbi:MAG: SpoIIE family protein phosphatase [Planctomycetota bacterium]|nr:SpoIIE family protein phosphatase [Planctomycetota bacterium]
MGLGAGNTSSSVPGVNSPGMFHLRLRMIEGPEMAEFTLTPGGRYLVGRLGKSDVHLPHEAVSREHALIDSTADGAWFLTDRGGITGTRLNGIRLPPEKPTQLAPGDLLRFGPWVFRVGLGADRPEIQVDLDRGPAQTTVHVKPLDQGSTADQRLALLSECLSRLYLLGDEAAMARAALAVALRGSGYRRGAVLRACDDGFVVIAQNTAQSTATPHDNQRGSLTDADLDISFSRRLLQMASGGRPVTMTGGANVVTSHSIVDMGIHSALCTPIVVGDAIDSYMYLDARGAEGSVRADAAAFCEALATLLGLAIASHRRTELERRERDLAAQLHAAHAAQLLILPPRDGVLGAPPNIEYSYDLRAGLLVAGDLFDAFTLQDGRVAVMIGDVTGHGAAAAMVMAACQARLAAELARTADPASAAQSLNTYLDGRLQPGHFVSLWLGVVSADGRVVYADAGHGHCCVLGPSSFERIVSPRGGIAVGIDPRHTYENLTLTIAPSQRLLLLSDGIVEQSGATGDRFGYVRLADALKGDRSTREDVAAAFAAFDRFSGRMPAQDDATVASLKLKN